VSPTLQLCRAIAERTIVFCRLLVGRCTWGDPKQLPWLLLPQVMCRITPARA